MREITEENFDEFVPELIKLKVIDSIRAQMAALFMGIYYVLPYHQLKWFSMREVMQLLGGVTRVDVGEFNTSVSDEIHRDLIIVGWCWEIVEGMNEEQVGNLVNFVSGSRYPPIGTVWDREMRWWKLLADSRVHLSHRVTSVEQSVYSYPKARSCFKELRLGH